MRTNLSTRKGRFSLLLTAALAVAITFTLNACGGDDGGGDDGGNTRNPDGSSEGNPPTSNAACGNELMSDNLNLDVPNSRCYASDPANCVLYGRLYDWATAMKLPAKCNSILSTDDPDCAMQEKHQGICSNGWHIPSKDEFKEYGTYECLKNQKGGFSHTIAAAFKDGGERGYWWSASETSDLMYITNRYKESAYYRFLNYDIELSTENYGDKSRMYSVRCVKD
ncbi:MAG: hypothetical protein LBH25_10135 [Fibromonadaceae bacterium]|jgi:uncharacterized protein (TIGR02145 family)|nr:hypothetical protein [Fibromonadaceae bacterium]